MLLTLTNDHNEQYEFKHIATIDYDNSKYMLLQPAEIEGKQYAVFELVEIEDKQQLIPLESTELISNIHNAYLEQLQLIKDNSNIIKRFKKE